ncbi:MAG: LPS export ABC transporter periplasmic protein LptC [Pseudomonadales bacterium]|nr:LPS export ABC transporter periplasmic protein LptC [Pseudomonadales bacterium]
MFNSRSILLIGLILLVAWSANWLIIREDAEEEAPAIGRNDPDLYMLDATITQFNDEGERQHIILADRLTHYPLTDMTSMIEPRVKLFSENVESPWDIESKNGRLLPESQLRSQIVELWDQVLATRIEENGDFVNIQTESLWVYPGRDYAETNRKVFIDDNSGRTSAAGMQAYLDEGKYIFFSGPEDRVNTILLPQFRK